jgi:hypothetical protein
VCPLQPWLWLSLFSDVCIFLSEYCDPSASARYCAGSFPSSVAVVIHRLISILSQRFAESSFIAGCFSSYSADSRWWATLVPYCASLLGTQSSWVGIVTTHVHFTPSLLSLIFWGFFLFVCSFVLFLQYWGLNSGPHASWVGALTLEPLHQPLLLSLRHVHWLGALEEGVTCWFPEEVLSSWQLLPGSSPTVLPLLNHKSMWGCYLSVLDF